jgi:hypothetical protein
MTDDDKAFDAAFESLRRAHAEIAELKSDLAAHCNITESLRAELRDRADERDAARSELACARRLIDEQAVLKRAATIARKRGGK